MTTILETVLERLEGQIKRRKGWQDEECEIGAGDARYLIDEVRRMEEEKKKVENEVVELKKKIAEKPPAIVPATPPTP